MKIKFKHPCPVHLTVAKAVIYSARRLLQCSSRTLTTHLPSFRPSGTGHHPCPPPQMASFKCSLSSPGKADLQTRGSSFLFHTSSGPQAPLKGTQGGMKSKQPPQSNLNHTASQPRRFLFLKQKEYSTFFTLSIFLSPSPTSSLLPPGL